MAKGNTGKGKAQRRDELERKRDERSRKKTLKKERDIKEYLENDENFASFKNQLEAIGLKIKDILGDGNCLFRALGDQLNGDHTSHAYHRKNTVQYMKNHRDDFEPFMEDGKTFEKHLTELSKLGTYGGNDSIVAFARNNGLDIVIHQLDIPRWVVHGSEYAKPGLKIELHLAYHNGEHYSSVRSLTDPDTEPAWQYNKKQSVTQSTGNPKENDYSKIKKKKGKKNNPDKSNPKPEMDMKTSDNEFCHEAAQVVMENTGCQDLELIVQILLENNYDIDVTISEILQVMCIIEDQDSDGANGRTNDVITEKEAIHTDHDDSIQQKSGELCDKKKTEEVACISVESNSDVAYSSQICDKTTDFPEVVQNAHKEDRKTLDEFVGNLRESLCNEPENNCKLHPGARPKQNIQKDSCNRVTHLTNRQRKDKARKEKTKRIEERRQTESKITVENNVSTIVADLGAVSI